MREDMSNTIEKKFANTPNDFHWRKCEPSAEMGREFDGKRLEQAMARSTDFQRDLYLDRALGVAGKVGKWKRGANDPSGEYLEGLCSLLSASAPFLYGASREECRRYLETVVRNELGDAEADALELIGRLSEDERRRVVASLAPPQQPHPRRTVSDPFAGDTRHYDDTSDTSAPSAAKAKKEKHVDARSRRG
jgi:hypothetical protein